MAYPLDKRTFSYGDLKVSGVTLSRQGRMFKWPFPYRESQMYKNASFSLASTLTVAADRGAFRMRDGCITPARVNM
jgi:hypothetical protein